MAAIGYTLSSEESWARELAAQAARAEEVGFSSRCSPTTSTRGWTARGAARSFGLFSAISQVTERLEPSDFEEATSLVREDDIAEEIGCGPDPQRHLSAVREYIDVDYVRSDRTKRGSSISAPARSCQS